MKKEKRIKNKISSLGYFQVELQEKKCLYKEKKCTKTYYTQHHQDIKKNK